MNNPDLVDFLERVKEWSSERQNDVVHMLTGMEASGTNVTMLR